MRFSLLCVALTLSAPAIAQTTWYVDDDAFPGPGTGTPDDPFYQIQAGVNAAADGDTILVLPGTYLENVDFTGKGLSLVSRDGPDVTRVEGQMQESVILIIASVPKSVAVQGFTLTGGQGHPVDFDYIDSAGGGVFASGVDLTLIGNTIESNHAGGGGGIFLMGGTAHVIRGNLIKDNAFSASYGGGLAVVSAAVTIEDDRFEGNRPYGYGYGKGASIYARDSILSVRSSEFSGNKGGSDARGTAVMCIRGRCLVADCWIHDNGGALDYGVIDVTTSVARIDNVLIESNQGFGIWADDHALITRCVIRGNVAVDTGALWLRGNSVVKDCVIEDNLCNDLYSIGPGGIRIESDKGAALVDCVIRGNSSEDGAGGISIVSSGGQVAILGCRIEDNVGGSKFPSVYYAGGIDVVGQEPLIANCLIAGNQAPKYAAIRASHGSKIFGCTITLNVCATGHAVNGGVRLVNSIVWDNQVQAQLGPATSAIYCDIAGGWPGMGVLDVDPQFVAPGADDFHLSPSSPLIDRGWDHLRLPVGTDIDGERRVRGQRIDIGADEAQ